MNKKNERIIGLVLGLIIYVFIYFVDFEEFYYDFNIKFDLNNAIAFVSGEYVWLLTTPIALYLVWRFRELLGSKICSVIKKLYLKI
jgi:hypothetical protein